MQPFAPLGGERVVTCSAIARGHAPLGGDPAFEQHALERGIERAFFHLQDAVGDLLNGVGDLVAVESAMHSERAF